MSDEIARLENEVAVARAALHEAASALHAARIAAAPVSVGDIVRQQKDGKLGRVVKVDVSWRDKPWVTVNPMKKNGEYGTAERNWFGYWDLVEGTP